MQYVQMPLCYDWYVYKKKETFLNVPNLMKIGKNLYEWFCKENMAETSEKKKNLLRNYNMKTF